MTLPLVSKPGITGAAALSIPKDWSAAWFRGFINNLLKGADVRNAIAGPGITITGNIASPYATISATGGAGAAVFSTSSLTHVAGVQPFVATDNFEQANGTAVDTAGTRFTGATPWTWLNRGAATAVQYDGTLVMAPDIGSPRHNCLQQPVSGSTWTIQCSVATYNAASADGGGLFVRDSVSGRMLVFFTYYSTNMFVQALTNPSTFNSTVGSLATGAPLTPGTGNDVYPIFYQIVFDGTTLFFNYSASGIPGTFHNVASQAAATFLGVSPTHWGICANSIGSNTARILFDQFQQTA